MSNPSAPTLHSVLYRRLVEILALDPTAPFTADTARDAIRGNVEGAVCCRIPLVEGRVRCFEDVYEAVFAQKLDGRPLTKRKSAA